MPKAMRQAYTIALRPLQTRKIPKQTHKRRSRIGELPRIGREIKVQTLMPHPLTGKVPQTTVQRLNVPQNARRPLREHKVPITPRMWE